MKITFSCEQHMLGALPNPVPAIKMAPKYFKDVKPQISNYPGSHTVKRCVPFLDALSLGFIIPLWCDIHVVARDGELSVDFAPFFPAPETLGSHSIEQMPNYPLSKLPYGKLLMKLINPWLIQTEPGVSCAFMSPLNHMETRFKILDGVVDTDTYYNNINFPFVWTGGDGEFFIPRGTPLVQVVPFRREETSLDVGKIDMEKRTLVRSVLGTKMKYGYKDHFWSGRRNKPEGDLETTPSKRQDHLEVDGGADQDSSRSLTSSEILEVTADDVGRGFGEGSF